MRTITLGLAVFSLAAAASAADYQLKMTAKAHKELVVRGYFGGSTCESSGSVEIDLNIPPKGGIVCMRSGMVRVENIWSGNYQNCIGKRIRGVNVIYIPFRRFTGLDTMRYTVTMSMTRTYEVEISVEAGEAKAAGASSAPSEPQQEGPMPVCPALVS